MKSILYVGATLMIGASIYGFVDYKNSSRKKEFTNMYEETEKKEPVIIADSKTTEPAVKKDIASSETKVVTTKKTASNKKETEKPVVKKKKKRINAEIFSRAPIREEEEIVELPQPAKKEVKKNEEKEQ